MILESIMRNSRVLHSNPPGARRISILNLALIKYTLELRSNYPLQFPSDVLDGDDVVGASNLSPVGNCGAIVVVNTEGVLSLEDCDVHLFGIGKLPSPGHGCWFRWYTGYDANFPLVDFVLVPNIGPNGVSRKLVERQSEPNSTVSVAQCG